jgi:hypothetical protein
MERFNGTWKRDNKRIQGVEKLIQHQGGGYFVRKLAVQSQVLHTLQFDTANNTIRLEEQVHSMNE